MDSGTINFDLIAKEIDRLSSVSGFVCNGTNRNQFGVQIHGFINDKELTWTLGTDYFKLTKNKNYICGRGEVNLGYAITFIDNMVSSI